MNTIEENNKKAWAHKKVHVLDIDEANKLLKTERKGHHYEVLSVAVDGSFRVAIVEHITFNPDEQVKGGEDE